MSAAGASIRAWRRMSATPIALIFVIQKFSARLLASLRIALPASIAYSSLKRLHEQQPQPARQQERALWPTAQTAGSPAPEHLPAQDGGRQTER